jgi:hypothetical protein
MAITNTKDSATISTTEYFIASDSTTAIYQTSSQIMQALIDTANMAAGDQYRIRVYEKINGSAARTIYDATLSGAQSGPHVTPSLIVCEGWEVSIQKLAGTDRVFGWAIRTVA